MIPVQTIVDRVTSILDAEGSDRYLFDQDFKPAINLTKDWVVAVFNKAFADKKLSEENLKELVQTKVWTTSTFSRVRIDPSVVNVWSILGIKPKPTVYPASSVPTVGASPDTSTLELGVSYISSDFSARRLTVEEWNENKNNIFEAGNNISTISFTEYAYLNQGDYSSINYTTAGELEVRPEVPTEFVAITYLRYPADITVIGDSLEFPQTLTDLVVNKVLNYISFKQGDQTNLFSVSGQEVATLAKLMM
jgi:hypothetical protein